MLSGPSAFHFSLPRLRRPGRRKHRRRHQRMPPPIAVTVATSSFSAASAARTSAKNLKAPSRADPQRAQSGVRPGARDRPRSERACPDASRSTQPYGQGSRWLPRSGSGPDPGTFVGSELRQQAFFTSVLEAIVDPAGLTTFQGGIVIVAVNPVGACVGSFGRHVPVFVAGLNPMQ